MAAIGTIRKYSGFAVGLIALAIIAFILSDALTNNSKLFNSNKTNVGVIAGQEISYKYFKSRFDEELDKYKQRQEIETIDEQTKVQLRDEVWKKLVDEIIFEKEYNDLGIFVSAEELTYIVNGPNPHQAVQQFFVDSNNQFDRRKLVSFLKNMDQYPEVKAIWLNFEEELEKEKVKKKYLSLVKAGLYVTDVEAKDDYYSTNKYANIDYITLPLKSIADSTISTTEKEIKHKYNEIKELHEIEESRSFEFIVFEVLPTKSDTFALFDKLEKFKKEFKNNENDSLFVEVNSDEHFDTIYHHRGYFTEAIDKAYFDNNFEDTIIGPYISNNFIKIAKLIEIKEDTIYYYRASHILIDAAGDTDQDTLDAFKKARELMAGIKNGDDFTMVAMRNSKDKQSAIKGGDLGWFKDGAMVKPFNDAVKKLSKGEMTVVKSQFGIHIVKLTEEKSNKLIQIGIISKEIEPSGQTHKDVYAQAVKFRGNIETNEEFQRSANESGFSKRIANEVHPDEPEIPGLNNSRKLINWAYKAKLNELSKIIEFDDKFVVAVITEINEEGPAPLEKIRDVVEGEIIKGKKQEILKEKLSEAIAQNTTIEGTAKALKLTVENLPNASYKVAILSGIGEERYLIGYIFGSEPGSLSEPIKGNNAIFQLKLNSFSEVEEPKDLIEIKNKLISNLQGMSQFETMESLKDAAKVQDLRYKWF
ncbi:MAG: SurA N-terminal domain-containing protein [Bacteroidota bacterium]|nr:SurA N-terminal domain-containing protein [Bacteroidota bacterium]